MCPLKHSTYASLERNMFTLVSIHITGDQRLHEPKLSLLAVYIAPLRSLNYINTLGDCSASNVTRCHMKAYKKYLKKTLYPRLRWTKQE